MSVSGSRIGSVWARWVEAAEVYRNRKQLIILLMGFSSGAPFLLTLSVLTYWMASVNVDLTTIGLFSLVGTPYAFKFVWAPLIDRLSLPLLSRRLGRRRAWGWLAQACLAGALVALGLAQPRADLGAVALLALLVSFCSASQDIVIDAWRVESLEAERAGAPDSIVMDAPLFPEDEADRTLVTLLQLRKIAEASGVDLTAWDECIADPAVRAGVEADAEEAKGLGITGTPTLILGDWMDSGIPAPDDLYSRIDAALAARGAVTSRGAV